MSAYIEVRSKFYRPSVPAYLANENREISFCREIESSFFHRKPICLKAQQAHNGTFVLILKFYTHT